MSQLTNDKILSLRSEMKKRDIDVYIIPSSDSHQSEYTPEHYKGREWISGFTGSAGTIIVSQDRAVLFTDARYFIQAESQLEGTCIELCRIGVDYPHYFAYLNEIESDRLTIGFDGKTLTAETVEKISRYLKGKSLMYNSIDDLLKLIWQDRPSLPNESVYELPVIYTGETRLERMNRLREVMKERGCKHHIVTTLDDIAWIFNIRGSDVEFNPVCLAYAIISEENAELYIGEERLNPVLADRMTSDNISIHPYLDFESRLKKFEKDDSVLVDKSTISYTHAQSLSEVKTTSAPLPSRQMKAIKNETEVEHIRRAMIKDGIALTKVFMWLEETVQSREIKETEVVNKLSSFRSQQDDYKGDSFDAIVGYNGNGAIIHYRAQHATAAKIKNEGYLLIDSGGQYLNGTTDITRTISFGTPSESFKKHYTAVLKGFIGLAQSIFPEGTRGIQLDIKAREYLWNIGYNYGHGTGHGVGFFLNVHEPPQGFTQNLDQRGKTKMKKGMLTSNEPGCYIKDEYGIRIENIVLNVPHESHDGFLKFEDLTLFPISTKNIELSLMSESEKKWLNAYHKKVYEQLSPGLNQAERDWLMTQCEKI